MNICSLQNGEDFFSIKWKRRICFLVLCKNFIWFFLLFCCFFPSVPKRRLRIIHRYYIFYTHNANCFPPSVLIFFNRTIKANWSKSNIVCVVVTFAGQLSRLRQISLICHLSLQIFWFACFHVYCSVEYCE